MTAAMIPALAAAAAVALMVPACYRPEPQVDEPPAESTEWFIHYRLLVCAVAGLGAGLFIGGHAGVVVGPVAGVAAWRGIQRVERARESARTERLRADLPHAIRLVCGALASGAPPDQALRVVAEAIGGPVGARFTDAVSRLALGADPVTVWSTWTDPPELARLGRGFARSQVSGASVTTTIARIADDASLAARARSEHLARSVGVRAAVPLGLCFLPAFVLVGIVPLAAGLFGSISW